MNIIDEYCEGCKEPEHDMCGDDNEGMDYTCPCCLTTLDILATNS